MTEPTADRAPATSPAGVPSLPIEVDAWEVKDNFIHALGCFDPFCTGYDERTPRNA